MLNVSKSFSIEKILLDFLVFTFLDISSMSKNQIL